MRNPVEDEDLLLAVLNSAPVVDGTLTDELDGRGGDHLVGRFGGEETSAEREHLRIVRGALQAVVRGSDDTGALDRLRAVTEGAVLRPEVGETGVGWRLDAPADRILAVRAVLAWSRVRDELPGRLRACANTGCNLYLVDHSRPGTAKWCSMATCGNRMKARAHARRDRAARTAPESGK